MKIMQALKNVSFSYWFLIVSAIAYIPLFFIKKDMFFSAVSMFWNIIVKIAPVFVLIFVLMALTEYFVPPQFILAHLSGKKVRAWLFTVVGGILSTGPIYMWYPFLADMRKKGVSYGMIACFLYNRAVKIPLIPIAILYFGLEYIAVLTSVMIAVSLLQGIIIDKLMKSNKQLKEVSE